MDQVGRIVLAVVVPVGLLALFVWTQVAVMRRNRRYYAKHPERRPFGWKLALRYVPFIIIGVGSALFLARTQGPGWYVMAGLMLMFFGLDLKKRWHRPSER